MSKTVTAWKIFHLRKDMTLGPLFVERERVLPLHIWLQADMEIVPKNLALRPGWHCASKVPPHIKVGKLANGEIRVLAKVQIRDFTEHHRPEAQGGLWYTAGEMKIMEIIN